MARRLQTASCPYFNAAENKLQFAYKRPWRSVVTSFKTHVSPITYGTGTLAFQNPNTGHEIYGIPYSAVCRSLAHITRLDKYLAETPIRITNMDYYDMEHWLSNASDEDRLQPFACLNPHVAGGSVAILMTRKAASLLRGIITAITKGDADSTPSVPRCNLGTAFWGAFSDWLQCFSYKGGIISSVLDIALCGNYGVALAEYDAAAQTLTYQLAADCVLDPNYVGHAQILDAVALRNCVYTGTSTPVTQIIGQTRIVRKNSVGEVIHDEVLTDAEQYLLDAVNDVTQLNLDLKKWTEVQEDESGDDLVPVIDDELESSDLQLSSDTTGEGTVSGESQIVPTVVGELDIPTYTPAYDFAHYGYACKALFWWRETTQEADDFLALPIGGQTGHTYGEDLEGLDGNASVVIKQAESAIGDHADASMLYETRISADSVNRGRLATWWRALSSLDISSTSTQEVVLRGGARALQLSENLVVGTDSYGNWYIPAGTILPVGEDRTLQLDEDSSDNGINLYSDQRLSLGNVLCLTRTLPGGVTSAVAAFNPRQHIKYALNDINTYNTAVSVQQATADTDVGGEGSNTNVVGSRAPIDWRFILLIVIILILM